MTDWDFAAFPAWERAIQPEDTVTVTGAEYLSSRHRLLDAVRAAEEFGAFIVRVEKHSSDAWLSREAAALIKRHSKWVDK